MKLTCVAVDDEPLALELIRAFASGIPSLELLHTFNDAVSARIFLQKNRVDILFVDINMPDINGIELVRSIKEKPVIIFTTAHRNYAYEGFELDAIDYLLKPISRERFAKAVQKAEEYIRYKKAPKEEEQKELFVYSEYKLVRVVLDDIEYIESLEDYVRIHLAGSRPLLTLMPLKKMLERLPEQRFRRIHRSYIVQTCKVLAIKNKKVFLAGNTELPVSESYQDFIRDWKQ